jgi:hypothetical protein
VRFFLAITGTLARMRLPQTPFSKSAGGGRLHKLTKAVTVMLLAATLDACGGGSSGGDSPAIQVTIAPSSASVATKQEKTFKASVLNDSSGKGVTWELSGAGCTGDGCGSLTSASTTNVTYRAPTTSPVPPALTLQATAVVADSTKSATANVTVFTPGTIAVSVAPSSTISMWARA